MSQDRKEASKDELTLKDLDPSPEVILEYARYNRRIPLLHLAQQFVNPGIPDDDKSAKSQIRIPSLEDLKDLTPNLCREEAFNRLFNKVNTSIEDEDRMSFVVWMQELLKKPNPSEYEKIIIAIAYQHGLGVEINKLDAFNLINKSVELEKNPYAQIFLTKCYYDGWGVNTNLELAYNHIQLSLRYGHLGIAWYKKAFLFSKGGFLEKNPEKELENLRLAAERNYSLSLHRLGAKSKSPKEQIIHFSKAIRLDCFGGILSDYAMLISNIGPTSALALRIELANYLERPWAGKEIATSLKTQAGIKDFPLAAFYYRVACLHDTTPDSENTFDAFLNEHEEDTTINYHYNMALDKQSELRFFLVNDPLHFNELWCADIDSKVLGIKQQAITRAITLAPDQKLENIPQRMRAELAIHYFNQDQEEMLGEEKDEKINDPLQRALCFTDGLGVTQLSADENFQLGMHLYNYAIKIGAMDALQYRSDNKAFDNLKKKGLIDETKDESEDDIFKINTDFINKALRFLTEASNRKHPEATKLLHQITTGKIVPDIKVSDQRLFRASLPPAHTLSPHTTSTARPLNAEDDPDQKTKPPEAKK